MKQVKVDPMWMVLLKHYSMHGGLFHYGEAEIIDICDSFEEAVEKAKKVYKQYEDDPNPFVWVMKCILTYQKGGVAVSDGENLKLSGSSILFSESKES